jgi:hypothetical protein
MAGLSGLFPEAFREWCGDKLLDSNRSFDHPETEGSFAELCSLLDVSIQAVSYLH